jgi:hypothetical protein
MLRFLARCAPIFLLVLGLQVAQPEPGQCEEGQFVSLFNGQNLDGWKASENVDSWSVEEGAIVCAGPRSHLFYVGDGKAFKDFHFKAEVKTTPGSNAGIYFHTKFQEEGWPKYGFECQVNVTSSDPKKTSSLYGVVNVADPPVKDNEWYTQEIIVKGKNIKLILNGQTMVDYTEAEGAKSNDPNFVRLLSEGTFALQAHDPESKVYFRNLQVKRL